MATDETQTPGAWGQSLVLVPASVNLSTPSHLSMHGSQKAFLQTPQEPMSTAYKLELQAYTEE